MTDYIIIYQPESVLLETGHRHLIRPALIALYN